MNKDDELLTVNEVSKILKVSEQTVRKIMKDGQLKYIKVGRSYRIPKAAIDVLLSKNA